MDRLKERDRALLWHPYTQHAWQDEVLPVKRAEGAYLELQDGRKILDAVSSWWVNLHGHSHPRIARAIAEQAAQLEHVIFAGFTHEPAVRLAEQLLSVLSMQRAQMSRVFYSDNGSTAVEVALKLAFQLQQKRGETRRIRYIALSGSYHGDTFGAMSVSSSGFESMFRPLINQVDFIPPGDLDSLVQLLEQAPRTYAGFIFEPCIQGAGGMAVYDPNFLRQAVSVCRDYGVLTIADEVFTGFYRTGKFFAFEHADLSPDLVCVSKGITGGFLPLSATIAPEWIFENFLDAELSQALLHGHSYTANPIACASGVASFDLLMEASTQSRIGAIAEVTRESVKALEAIPAIEHSWSFGTIGAVSLRSKGRGYFSGVSRAIRKAAIAKGVLIRPLGNVLYAVPPYCTTDDEVRHIYQTIGDLARTTDLSQ